MHIIEVGELAESSDALGRRLAAGHVDNVLDLSALRCLSWTAMRWLIVSLRTARSQGGSLSLIAGNEAVAKDLEATALTRIFNVYASRSDAQAELAAAA
ncbi:MAG: STAS domain-containing protein [Candidatus Eremiobacteraeota bacterium]|nr:STAS domain-containing protein [Candidatus Eremiobacteraeota bacterium]